MKPVAKALDILQGDKNIYMGYLLPTVTVIKKTLQRLPKMTYCEALKTAELNGLLKR